MSDTSSFSSTYFLPLYPTELDLSPPPFTFFLLLEELQERGGVGSRKRLEQENQRALSLSLPPLLPAEKRNFVHRFLPSSLPLRYTRG